MSAGNPAESDSDGAWEEEGMEAVSCKCLFCCRQDEGGTGAILSHCKEHHKFDLHKFREKLGKVLTIIIRPHQINFQFLTHPHLYNFIKPPQNTTQFSM